MVHNDFCQCLLCLGHVSERGCQVWLSSFPNTDLGIEYSCGVLPLPGCACTSSHVAELPMTFMKVANANNCPLLFDIRLVPRVGSLATTHISFGELRLSTHPNSLVSTRPTGHGAHDNTHIRLTSHGAQADTDISFHAVASMSVC